MVYFEKMSHGKIVASEPSHWTIKNPAPCWNGMKLKIRKGYNMPKFSFGRTNFKQSESIFDKLKKFKLQDLKNLKWKDLTPQQKKKVILGFVGVVLLLLFIGVFSENDEEAYKSNINSFIKESAAYDVTSTAKTTTSSAHQLIVSQSNKIKQTKAKNYKTKVNSVETKIASQKGNSIIGTTRVNTTEQMGNDTSQDFTHLFIFQGQKVGASWKISNLLEAEAKIQNKKASDGSTPTGK